MSRILIIEDDPRIASVLEIRFRTNGYEVVAAADARVGGTLALQLKPDLLCLDISLPGGDGMRLAEGLRRQPETMRIPIIFITGSLDPSLRRQTMELGAAGLFGKPYDPEELLQVIRHTLGESTFTRKAPRSDATSTTNPIKHT